MVTSTANNLHKAHAQYLEARLVQLALEAQNVELENNTKPALPSLSEAAQANMEAFIDQLLMVLPAIRVDLFTTKVKAPVSNVTNIIDQVISPVFELTLKKEGITATAVIEGSDFVVEQGSFARSSYIGEKKVGASYWKLYDKLVEQGVLVDEGMKKVFAKSYAFSSTSAAGAICNGRPTAGPVAWKVKGTGQTYKDWEAANLNADNHKE